MKKIMINVLNVLSALPIIIYPILLVTSIMVFAVPGVTKSATGLITGFSMLLFPVVIVTGIILSRKYNSITWAIIACIPLIVFAGVLIKNTILNRGSNKHSDLYNRTSAFSKIITNSKLIGVWIATPGSENGAILGQEKIEFTEVDGVKTFKNVYGSEKNTETYSWQQVNYGEISIIKNGIPNNYYISFNEDGTMLAQYKIDPKDIPTDMSVDHAVGYYKKLK